MSESANSCISQSRIQTNLAMLGVDPGIAQKTAKFLRYVDDSGSAAIDAAKALRDIKATGNFGSGGVALAASIFAAGGASTDLIEAKSASLALNVTSWSLNMGKAMTMTPGRASAFVAVAVVQKGLAVAGIASEKEISQCKLALGKLAADVAVTALTWETGIGAVLGVAGGLLDGGLAIQACSQ